MPPLSFDFVVSAENNYYNSWQAMLFHYTCMKQMKQAPIIVVHGDDREELLRPFELIRQHGGRIQRARNFRYDAGWDYPPRNTAGSLSVVQSDADFLVLCDPDMVIFRPLPLDQLGLANHQISYDRVTYLTVKDENRDQLEECCRAVGVALQSLADHRFSGGVPHVIPRVLQARLSSEWLRCMTFFEPADAMLRKQPGFHVDWLATMWALTFAIQRLDLEVVMTEWNLINWPGTRRTDEFDKQTECIVHYCYNDKEFNKRDYMDESGACSRVWKSSCTPHTINALIVRELREAADFYSINCE